MTIQQKRNQDSPRQEQSIILEHKAESSPVETKCTEYTMKSSVGVTLDRSDDRYPRPQVSIISTHFHLPQILPIGYITSILSTANQ
jgi:hypothetical protein